MVAPQGILEAAKLVDDASGRELVIWPSNGAIYLNDFDLGFPQIRANSVERVAASGTVDYTETFGASTVALSFKILPAEGQSAPASVDELRRWQNPRLRPRLVYTLVGLEEREVTLSPRQAGSPFGFDILRSSIPMVQLQWVNPEGRSFDSTDTEVEMVPNSGLGSGRTYPTTYNRTYAALVPPFWEPDIDGTIETYPVATIYGPVQNPSLTNLTTGQTVGFASYSLAIGETLVIDFAAKTAKLNGVTNVRGSLTQRDWWGLQPGVNEIAFDTDQYAAQTKVVFSYRNAFI